MNQSRAEYLPLFVCLWKHTDLPNSIDIFYKQDVIKPLTENVTHLVPLIPEEPVAREETVILLVSSGPWDLSSSP